MLFFYISIKGLILFFINTINSQVHSKVYVSNFNLVYIFFLFNTWSVLLLIFAWFWMNSFNSFGCDGLTRRRVYQQRSAQDHGTADAEAGLERASLGKGVLSSAWWQIRHWGNMKWSERASMSTWGQPAMLRVRQQRAEETRTHTCIHSLQHLINCKRVIAVQKTNLGWMSNVYLICEKST